MAGEVGTSQRAGEAIRARMHELGIEPDEVDGVSYETIYQWWKGERLEKAHRTKKRALCAALGWRWDAIDRLLAGEEPVLADPEPEPADVVGILKSVLGRIDALATDSDRRLSRLEADMAQLARDTTQAKADTIQMRAEVEGLLRDLTSQTEHLLAMLPDAPDDLRH